MNDSDRMGRIESLVNALEALPDTAARAAARELVRSLLDLHAVGLQLVLALAGTELTSRLAEDERVVVCCCYMGFTRTRRAIA